MNEAAASSNSPLDPAAAAAAAAAGEGGRGRRAYVCRAFATFAGAISVLINKRRRAPCLSAATLLCAEMSFGTSVTSFPALPTIRFAGCPRAGAFRYSGW
jgi:hypothetical protein